LEAVKSNLTGIAPKFLASISIKIVRSVLSSSQLPHFDSIPEENGDPPDI
jgi:hypothetical protein